MRWLVRRLLKQGKGAVSYEEDVHFGDTLTIGRAADQASFLSDLRAALNHARVSAEPGGRYKVESLILAGIRVDGQLTYGIDVGRLAGLPAEVVSRARVILRQLEGAHTGGQFRPDSVAATDQLSLFNVADSQIIERLKRVDPDAMTPIQALNILSELKQMLEDKR